MIGSRNQHGTTLNLLRKIGLLLSVSLGHTTLTAQVTTRTDETGKLILKWHGDGTAAGLNGFYYENRDGGHSPFDVSAWPQLQVYQPTTAEKEKKADTGPANQVRPFPLLGNSSMSAPADKGGSLPRIYMGAPQGFEFLNGQYLNNNLFFYPEHQDYDAGWNGRNGWGDLYPANTPFTVISQGSSFTDQPFLKAFFATAAALPPETQSVLLRNRILVPTLQAIFRQSNRVVKTPEDYFTGAAHPPVFDGNQLDEARMVTAAHDMLPPLIPPIAVLELKEESGASPNKDFFELDPVKDEKLGTVPGAIARVFRGAAGERHFTVSARKSADLMRRPLTFKWVLLQGDPSKVKIETEDNGATARITLAWHPAIQLPSGLVSHRVDLAVFVGNGVAWSAPAFVSCTMLPNEQRFYDEQGRTQEICYQAGNPDLGLPAATDLRWLALGRKFDADHGTRGTRLLEEAMGSAAAARLHQIAEDLAPAQEAWRKLTAAGDASKSAADAAMQKLQEQLQQRLTTADGGNAPLTQVVELAVSRVADSEVLWQTPSGELESLAAASPKSNASATWKASLKRLLDLGVLQAEVGRLSATWQKNPGAGNRYQLRQYNLTLLSEVFLPEFLERSTAQAFVDPRLSVAKAWRDVYVYGKDGLCVGWTRYTNGRAYEFDLEGWLLPQGRNGKSVAVKYVRDEATGTLIFVPR